MKQWKNRKKMNEKIEIFSKNTQKNPKRKNEKKSNRNGNEVVCP